MSSPWDHPENVARLKALWAAGRSCSEIAAIIGNTTRNAVIGKVNRLGLSGRKVFRKKGQKNGRRRLTSIGINRLTLKNRILAARLKAEEHRAALESLSGKNAPEDAGRKTFAEIEPGDCRYIPFEPTGKCFCALPVMIGSSYCLQHHLRTTVPTSVRTPKAPAEVKESVEA